MLGRAKEHPELFLNNNDRETLEAFWKKNFHEEFTFTENMGANKRSNFKPSLYSHPENLIEIMADGEFRNGGFRSQIQSA
jgi:hypothetical protein